MRGKASFAARYNVDYMLDLVEGVLRDSAHRRYGTVANMRTLAYAWNVLMGNELNWPLDFIPDEGPVPTEPPAKVSKAQPKSTRKRARRVAS